MTSSGNKGGIIVRHREYIMDISPSATFVNRAYAINPGLASTFPWLSQVTDAFEEYRFRGLVFEYRSLSSDTILSSGTSTALGSVIMCTNYNANQTPFPDKRAMENYEGATSSKPTQPCVMAVDVGHGTTPLTQLYIRVGEPKQNEDKRLYDLGSFNLATVGMQNTTGSIGELWCTYVVELYKPKYRGAIGGALLGDHYQLSLARGNMGTGATNALPYGSLAIVAVDTPPTTDQGSFQLGTHLSTNGIAFPTWTSGMTFLITYTYQTTVGMGAGTIQPTITFSGPVGFSYPAPYGDAGFNAAYDNVATATTVYTLSYYVTIGQTQSTTVPFVIMSFTGTSTGIVTTGGIQLVDIYIHQVNLGLLERPDTSSNLT